MITIIEKPKYLALDLKLFKSHLRIEHNYEDEYLKTLIESATEILEKKMGMSILKKKYRYIGKKTKSIPIFPILKIFPKDKEVQFYAGIAESISEIPSDIVYAILQITKNMYEGNNEENFLESQYIKHIINSYKKITLD